MKDLSAELQQLVQVGRVADRPSGVDKERNRRQLQLRLGVTIGLAASPLVAAQIPASAPLLVGKIAGIALASAALVFGGASYLRGSGGIPWTQTAPPVDSSMVLAPPTASFADDSDMDPTPDDHRSQSAEMRSARRSGTVQDAGTANGVGRERDTLSEEVALLARAQTELQGGRFDSALRWLKEHERRFRRGSLAEERIAAKIQVLCALGRVAEASAHLASLSPKSVHGDATRHACGGAPKQPSGQKPPSTRAARSPRRN